MKESHLSFRQIEEYAARRLPAEEIPALHEHAESCPACHADLEARVSRFSAEHLSEQEAVDFVADRLSAEEKDRLSEHVDLCVVCSELVADLEAFRESEGVRLESASVTEMPRRRFWLLPAAAALVAVAGGSLWLT